MKTTSTRACFRIVLLSLTFSHAIPSNVNDQYRPLGGCYQKLQPGKKTDRAHVGRIVKCETIRDCRRICDYERSFLCRGFNYRYANDGSERTCELTFTPYLRMDERKDFLTDNRCDYYERDGRCFPDAPFASSESNIPRIYSVDDETSDSNPRGSNGRHRVDGTERLSYPEFLPRFPNESVLFARHGSPPDKLRRFPLLKDRQLQWPYLRETLTSKYPFVDKEDYGSCCESGSARDSGIPPIRGFATPVDSQNWPKSSWYPRASVHEGAYDGTYDGAYGAVYGPSYGYGSSIEWTQSRESLGRLPVISQTPDSLPLPRSNEHFYGKFYNYGGAFDYGSPPHESDRVANDVHEYESYDGCFVRAASGSKLASAVVRKTVLAQDSRQCEHFCREERSFRCSSFTYRYTVLPTDPTNNCLLTDLPYRELSLYTDLEPRREYDVYSLLKDSRICNSKQASGSTSSDECFSRVKSGFGMPVDLAKTSLLVENLGECQVACTTSQRFVCRTVAFKYPTATSAVHDENEAPPLSSNCFLTDLPSSQINPADMPDMDGAELYERGSYAHGCELYPPFLPYRPSPPPAPLPPPPPPPPPPPRPSPSPSPSPSPYPYPYPLPHIQSQFDPHLAVNNNGLPASRTDQDPRDHRDCYSWYREPCRLTPRVVLSSLRVDSETACRKRCSTMRNLDPVPCMSFSFKIVSDDTESNCLLSDVPLRDLRPRLDYVRETGHSLYAWQDHEPRCRHRLTPIVPANFPFTISQYYPKAIDSFDESLVGPSIPNGQIPSQEGATAPSSNQHPRNRPPSPFTLLDGSSYAPDTLEREFDFFYPGGFSTFGRYTVNGHPCKNGTVCQRNHVAGFWSCQLDDAEYGSWDYCCEPNHRCGFSPGYRYPWCYVGSTEDQWRPCSETYHPYYATNHHSGYRRSSEYHRYSARHWPVIYLHDKPPPNSTNSAILSANLVYRRGLP